MEDRKLKTFISRKNQVSLVKNIKDNTLYVEKIMKVDTRNFEKEVYYLHLLYNHGLAVPQVIDYKDNRIRMTYIGSTTLLDCLTQWEIEARSPFDDKRVSAAFIQLMQWLESFYELTHKATGKHMRLGDSHFRNFLIQDGKIFGIDFEACCQGTREMDGGRLCAYLLTYDPLFTKWKVTCTQLLIDLMVNQYDYVLQPLMTHMEQELMEINQRRWGGEKKRLIKKMMTDIAQKNKTKG